MGDEWQCEFAVGVQHFHIGPRYETKEEAIWMCQMLGKALAKFVLLTTGVTLINTWTADRRPSTKGIDMSDETTRLRNHVASYKSLSSHRQNCLDVCDEHDAQAQRLKELTEALELITGRAIDGCEAFSSPSNCLTAGRMRDAEYGADQWCDACVAREALKEQT